MVFATEKTLFQMHMSYSDQRFLALLTNQTTYDSFARTGLRNIRMSYSKISTADVAKKLRLESPNPVAHVESIVSKAIRDGAIDATVDHGNGLMVSKETGDIYSTNEPQIAFNSRIAFCLNMHSEAVRALQFPPNSHKAKESVEKRREGQRNT
ncbi:probable 26S proteasome non-ATPase regulatory subunit 3 [Primulina eburnea]|uniref:probable 26S proteasome non-ATPase regulatory subunit 3 n=1 Tax=Primulina eburnea TaxID=1245227 RepID=UPI003C6C7B05